jgi:hypothetical protein
VASEGYEIIEAPTLPVGPGGHASAAAGVPLASSVVVVPIPMEIPGNEAISRPGDVGDASGYVGSGRISFVGVERGWRDGVGVLPLSELNPPNVAGATDTAGAGASDKDKPAPTGDRSRSATVTSTTGSVGGGGGASGEPQRLGILSDPVLRTASGASDPLGGPGSVSTASSINGPTSSGAASAPAGREGAGGIHWDGSDGTHTAQL